MGRGRSWTDVPGYYSDCIADEDIDTLKVSEGTKQILRSLLEEDCIEIHIEFKSSGFYTPAKLSGPPEDCYPADGEDERELVEIQVNGKHVDDPAASEIFDAYYSQVEDALLSDS